MWDWTDTHTENLRDVDNAMFAIAEYSRSLKNEINDVQNLLHIAQKNEELPNGASIRLEFFSKDIDLFATQMYIILQKTRMMRESLFRVEDKKDYRFVFKLVNHEETYEYIISLSESYIHDCKRKIAARNNHVCDVFWDLLSQVNPDLRNRIDFNDVCWKDVHIYDAGGNDLLIVLLEASE